MAAGESNQPPARTFGVPWPALNDGLTYSDVVKSVGPAMTLIQFYSAKYASSAPLQGWLQRIRNGQIKIDGVVVTDPETILRSGSVLVYHRLPWEEPDAPHKLEVLYEDNEIMALNKPSGLQVLAGGLFQQRTVLTQLKWRASKNISSSHVSEASSAVKEQHPVPVHRLGRGTSGILLCAKTKQAKVRLASYFADGTSALKKIREVDTDAECTRKILKVYLALVAGIIEMDEVAIESPIGVIDYPGVSKGLYAASPSGKPALSKVAVLERNAQRDQTLVQVEIRSGRPHQIRIHLAFIGHPLVGDPLYVTGGRPVCIPPHRKDENFAEDGGYCKPSDPLPGDCGYYLHAHKLGLFHPSRDLRIEIVAPPPPVLRLGGEPSESVDV